MLRGEMSPLRKYVCDQAFARLDADRKGYINVSQLRAAYDPSLRTEYLSGSCAVDHLFQEDLNAGFDGSQRMDAITRDDFRTYWATRGATIDDDKVFGLLVFSTFGKTTKRRDGGYRVGWA
ncbi:hypothetical protein HK104_003758 [Borealophlyctis nickersoniae]|nr:hypothetical protein HK104_003758 [Borealophlyctis nickersoniae]